MEYYLWILKEQVECQKFDRVFQNEFEWLLKCSLKEYWSEKIILRCIFSKKKLRGMSYVRHLNEWLKKDFGHSHGWAHMLHEYMYMQLGDPFSFLNVTNAIQWSRSMYCIWIQNVAQWSKLTGSYLYAVIRFIWSRCPVWSHLILFLILGICGNLLLIYQLSHMR